MNFPSYHIFCQQYRTVLMYSILQVDTFPSGNILAFVRLCRNILNFVWRCHKCLWHACECVNWHRIIYVWNVRVQHIIFFRSVPSCARRACIGSSLTNFSEHTPYLPQLPEILSAFWASSFSIQVVLFRKNYRRECHLHRYQGWYDQNEKMISLQCLC